MFTEQCFQCFPLILGISRGFCSLSLTGGKEGLCAETLSSFPQFQPLNLKKSLFMPRMCLLWPCTQYLSFFEGGLSMNSRRIMFSLHSYCKSSAIAKSFKCCIAPRCSVPGRSWTVPSCRNKFDFAYRIFWLSGLVFFFFSVAGSKNIILLQGSKI